MKKLLFLTSFCILLFTSCSNENEEILYDETSNSEAQMRVIPPPPPLESSDPNPNPPSFCFDFPNTNEDYDCGWTRGYYDYAYHYNYIANLHNYGNCYEMLVGNLSPSSTSDPVLFTVPISSGYIIPNLVKSEFKDFYNMLSSKQNNSDYDLGRFHGYIAFRNSEPLSTNPNCLPGNNFTPNVGD